MRSIPKNRRSEGMVATANIQRQFVVGSVIILENQRFMPKAEKRPMVMASWKEKMMVPRTSGGDISPRYIGATMAEIPIAKPINRRPAMTILRFIANAAMRVPIRKRTAVSRMDCLRPKFLAQMPLTIAPTRAPMGTEATIKPWRKLSWRVLF